MRDWTPLDDERILALLGNGMTRSQIAREFGVTRNAICGRIHRLGRKSTAHEDEDPRIRNRRMIIRSLTSALQKSTNEAFRERALWIIETKQSEINCLLAVADCHNNC